MKKFKTMKVTSKEMLAQKLITFSNMAHEYCGLSRKDYREKETCQVESGFVDFSFKEKIMWTSDGMCGQWEENTLAEIAAIMLAKYFDDKVNYMEARRFQHVFKLVFVEKFKEFKNLINISLSCEGVRGFTLEEALLKTKTQEITVQEMVNLSEKFFDILAEKYEKHYEIEFTRTDAHRVTNEIVKIELDRFRNVRKKEHLGWEDVEYKITNK